MRVGVYHPDLLQLTRDLLFRPHHYQGQQWDTGFSQVAHNSKRERPTEANSTIRAAGANCLGRPVCAPQAHLPGWQIALTRSPGYTSPMLILFGMRLLEVMFFVGIVGSAVVVLITSFEDMYELFGKSEEFPAAEKTPQQ
jgi:hypothetical protein